MVPRDALSYPRVSNVLLRATTSHDDQDKCDEAEREPGAPEQPGDSRSPFVRARLPCLLIAYTRSDPGSRGSCIPLEDRFHGKLPQALRVTFL